MDITITNEDFKNATSYMDGKTCPLAEAIKRTIGHEDLRVYPDTVDISGDKYSISKNWCTPEVVLGTDTLIAKSKAGETVESITVTLTKLHW